MPSKIDHLVIAAKDLTQGVDYVRELLSVDIPFGGEHIKMATHNHLMQLGNGVFLEVIAVNEEETAPSSPRWYGLDDPAVRQSIQTQPRLLTWVINTANINALIQKANFYLGQSALITRGNLSWNFGLPEDGRLLASGFLPYAIQWHTDTLPGTAMANLGCTLQRLEIFHPYAPWLKSALQSIDALALVQVNLLPANETPYLIAHIQTAKGIVALSSASSALDL